MKVRQGFVSNSSSTSFCIYGIYVGEDNKTCEELDELASKLGLFTHWGQFDGIYIGKELSSMKDDESFGQFKEKTQSLICQLPIENMKCDVITEGWFNG